MRKRNRDVSFKGKPASENLIQDILSRDGFWELLLLLLSSVLSKEFLEMGATCPASRSFLHCRSPVAFLVSALRDLHIWW